MRLRSLLGVLVIGLGASFVATTSASAATTRVVPTTPGYWLVGGDGGVFSFNAPFYGSGQASGPGQGACGEFPPAPDQCVGISSLPDGSGYWLLSGAAYAQAFGGAGPLVPATSCTVFNNGGALDPGGATGMASTSSGKGYWMVTGPGYVWGCGDAPAPLGGPTSVHIGDDGVGMAATADGKGYWVAGADGGVFAFGDAGFYGSMGGKALNAPVVGIAATPDGKGYWLVAADGGVFSFGDAGFYGSMGGKALNAPVVGIAATPDGKGYWEAAADGGVFSFGSAPFEGSMGGKPLAQSVTGIATYAHAVPV
jgi:hypothetical protein